jgi:hypothetical protein
VYIDSLLVTCVDNSDFWNQTSEAIMLLVSGVLPKPDAQIRWKYLAELQYVVRGVLIKDSDFGLRGGTRTRSYWMAVDPSQVRLKWEPGQWL